MIQNRKRIARIQVASLKVSIYFAVLLHVPAFTQTRIARFEHLTSWDGLSQSNVKCILQDQQGFLWFGTADGLNKYDGYRFHVYRNHPDDSLSLCADDIYTLHEDSAGMIWIGTSNGLSIYDPRMDRFINNTPIQQKMYRQTHDRYIQCIMQDDRNQLWFGTDHDGLWRFDPTTFESRYYRSDSSDANSISSNKIRALLQDSHGRVWIGTSLHGLNLYDPATDSFIRFQSNPDNPGSSVLGNHVGTLAEDDDGILWIGCDDAGLSYLNLNQAESFQFSHIRFNPNSRNGLPSDQYQVLLPDRVLQGLWIGTDNDGLIYLDSTRTTFTQYKTSVGNPNTLNNNSIYSLYQDSIGDLWIGTYAGGVNVIHHMNQVFKLYNGVPGSSDGLIANSTWDFDVDQKGKIWIATDGGGLNCFDEERNQHAHYTTNNTNLSADAVLSVCVDSRDRIWIGTWAKGLFRLNPDGQSFTACSSPNGPVPAQHIFNISKYPDGTLWLATLEDGLIHFDPDRQSYKAYTTQNSDLIYDHVSTITCLDDGTLAVGTLYGLCFLDPKTEAFVLHDNSADSTNRLSYNFITSICQENLRTLWIGTMHGLNRLDRITGQVQHFFAGDGLPNNAIKSLEFDDLGYLWISTNLGLSRMDTHKNTFKNFTVSDGLQGSEFIRNSSMKLPDGRLIFGGTDGFNIFDPDRIRVNPHIPKIVITEFKLFGQSVKVGSEDSPLKSEINWMDQLVLSHKQSILTFEFAALNYTSPEKNQHAYMLENFDSDWQFIGNQRIAHYTNIQPGKYVFRAKGSNNDGVWNETGKAIQITIKPPFWNTVWFRLIVLLLGVAGILLAYYHRIGRVNALNRKLEARVSQRTAQLEAANKELEAFAYSISHDLRAPLRAMIGFSSAIKEDCADKLEDEAEHYIERIQESGHRMEQLIDDLLRLSRLSKKEIHFSTFNLSLMVRKVAEELCKSVPDREIKLDIMEGIEIYGDKALIEIVIKNLLDNAVKFTSMKKETIIEFGQKKLNNKSNYYIRDNGVGIDNAYADKIFNVFQRQHTQFEGTGIGLATVTRIIKRHGGRIWAKGEVNKGATFFFTFPDS